MLKDYWRIAWRSIKKHKAYSFINILGLSLGICACLVIYLIAHYELSFDNFHPDSRRICRIVHRSAGHDAGHTVATVPPVLPLAARKEIPGLDAIAGYHLYPAEVHTPGQTPVRTETAIITSPEYFSIFPYEWIAGSPASALKYPFKVVLTENAAIRYFGNMPPDSILGKELIYNDSLRLAVSGIVRDAAGNTDFPFTEFISLSTISNSFLKEKIDLDHWGTADMPWASRAFVKLGKDVSPEHVNARLTTLVRSRIHLEPGDSLTVSLQPLADIHFDSVVDDGIVKAHRPTLYALIAIAAFILLLAVINFINLATAISLQRSREVGIRKVLGSLRSGLVLQFLIETGILTCSAVFVAVLLAKPVLRVFHATIPAGVTLHILQPHVLLFLFLITLFTTFLAGIYPAKALSAYRPALSLKAIGDQKGGEKWWLRKSLIVFQFTISLFFIIGTVVVERQISYMRNEDLGFSSDAVITIDTKLGDQSGRSKLLAAQLRQIPGIRMVARQSFDPITGFHTTLPIHYNGADPVDIPAALQIGDENFIPLYKMKLLAGNNLRHQDSLREFVINESMSRALGFTDPNNAVGKLLFLGQQALPIRGVVADFHEYNYHEAIRPIVIADLPPAETSIALRLGSLHADEVKRVVDRIRQQWKTIYPEIPFTWHFLDDTIAHMYTQEQQTAFLLKAATIVTILISCMGLLGLAMFAARQRTKEIGIRKALGATAGGIVLLLSRQFLLPICLAACIASPVALYSAHLWLRNFAYRIPVSPWIFFLSVFGALVIAFLTVLVQTIRLALVDPVRILRTE